MWEMILGWLKGLFGGKGTTQIGPGNQAMSGSTSGDHSPAISAGRDVYYTHAAPAISEPDIDGEILGDLEDLMPGFLADLRGNLAEDPLFRHIAVVPRESSNFGIKVSHAPYARETYPEIDNYIDILENYGMVEEKHRKLLYRMTEEFVRLLRRK